MQNPTWNNNQVHDCCNIIVVQSCYFIIPWQHVLSCMNMAVDLSWWFQQRCSSMFVHQDMDSLFQHARTSLPLCSSQWALYIYISGVRSSGHRVKPNMAAMEALSYVGFSLPTRSFMYTCYVKIAQGDWNRRNSGPPCPPYLASLFAQSATGRSHSIYMYIYGAHWFKLASSTMFTPVNKLKQDVRFYVRSLN